MEKRNKIYLEIIRVVAIFLVIVNHTPGWQMPEFVAPYGGLSYWMSLFFCEVVKMAVPLFFMISGSLLLNRDESAGSWFRKRVCRFLLAMAIVVLLQYLYHICTTDESFGWGKLFAFLRRGSSINDFKVLWFLKVYIILMLLLPVMRFLIKRMSGRVFIGLLLLQFVFYVVFPLVMMTVGRYDSYIKIRESLTVVPLPFSLDYCVLYFLMGFWLERVKVNFSLSLKVWSVFLSLMVACICMELSRKSMGTMSVLSNDVFLISLLSVPCAAVYLIVKDYVTKSEMSQRLRNMWGNFGSAVFVVMLSENIFRLVWSFLYDYLSPYIGYMAAGVVQAAICFVCALILGLCVKHTPILRNIF